MTTVSTQTLNRLAALVWYIGAIVLLYKGVSLLREAASLKPELVWTWSAVVAGPSLGLFKAKFLFNKSCQKNLNRIARLKQPKIWQFFRPGFFVALAGMILVGASLSRLAHNNYPFLITVALLDLSLATALLGSSYIFWTNEATEH